MLDILLFLQLRTSVRRMDDCDRLMVALKDDDVPRVRQLFKVALKRGSSINHCIKQLHKYV